MAKNIDLDTCSHYKLVFGYIPEGAEDSIMCGDYENSAMVVLPMEDLNAYDAAGNLLCECAEASDFWAKNSKFWAALGELISKKTSAARAMNPVNLQQFWSVYTGETEESDVVIPAEAEFGEISDVSEYGDTFFAYVVLVEDGEAEEEGSVFIIK